MKLGEEGNNVSSVQLKAEVGAGSGKTRKIGTFHLCLMVASTSQVSRLTWFTRHEPVVQKDPANPLPPTLSQNGTTEATGTSIQLETIQENLSKANSRELPLVSVRAELRSIVFGVGESVRSHYRKGEG